MRKKFDDATEREIYDAYRTGEYLYKDLADKYDCSVSTVFKIVSHRDAKNGVITQRHKGNKPAPKRFDHDTERVIYTAYRGGETSTSLAAKYDCNPTTILNIVDRCDAEDGVKTKRHFSGRGGGFSLLSRGRLSYKMSNKQAIEMYVARRRGATCRQLAERYGISDSCVCEISKRIEKCARERGLKI